MANTRESIELLLKTTGAKAVQDAVGKLTKVTTTYGKGVKTVTKEYELQDKSLKQITQKFATLDNTIVKVKAHTEKIGKETRKVAASYYKAGEQIAKTTKHVKELDRGFLGTGDRLTTIMAKVTTWGVATGILYGTIRAVRELTDEFLTLEKAMARVATVTRPETGVLGNLQQTINTMRREVMDFAVTSPAKIDDVAQSLYYLGSAGLDVADQLGGMRHIANLAVGTWGDVGEISKTVAGIVNNFGDSLKFARTEEEKFDYVTDLIAKTFSEQQVEISEIASAFQLAGSAAGIMDISLQELVGTVGFLNTGMLKGSKAGTALLNAFIQMGSKANKLRYAFGVMIDPNKPLNFMDILEQLHTKVGDFIETQEVMTLLWDIFGRRGGRAISLVLKNWNQFKQSINKLDPQDIDGYAEKLEELASNNLIDRFKTLGHAIAGVADAVAEVSGIHPLELTKRGIEQTTKGLQAIRQDLLQPGGPWGQAIAARGQLPGMEQFAQLPTAQPKRMSEIIPPGFNEALGFLPPTTSDEAFNRQKKRFVQPGQLKEEQELLDKEMRRHELAMARLDSEEQYLEVLAAQATLMDEGVAKERAMNQLEEAAIAFAKRKQQERQRALNEVQILQMNLDGASEKEILEQRLLNLKWAQIDPNEKIIKQMQIQLQLAEIDKTLKEEQQQQIKQSIEYTDKLIAREMEAQANRAIKSMLDSSNYAKALVNLQDQQRIKKQLLYGETVAAIRQKRILELERKSVLSRKENLELIQLQNEQLDYQITLQKRAMQLLADFAVARMDGGTAGWDRLLSGGVALLGEMSGLPFGDIIGGAVGSIVSKALGLDRDEKQKELDLQEDNTRAIRELNDTMRTFTERYINAPSTFAIAGDVPQMASGGRILKSGLAYVHAGEEIRQPDPVGAAYTTKTYDQSTAVSIDKVQVIAQPGQDARQIAQEVITILKRTYDRGGQYESPI